MGLRSGDMLLAAKNQSCAIPWVDSFLYTVSAAHLFSTTARFLRSCKKYGLIFSAILVDDGVLNPGTGSEVTRKIPGDLSALCISFSRSCGSV